jgi:hypothetical protein
MPGHFGDKHASDHDPPGLRAPQSTPYSARSASIGLIRAARRAGR